MRLPRSRRGFLLPLVSCVLGFGLVISECTAAEWPAGCVVGGQTVSPDGRYGIVLPGHETGEEGANYLADLKKHELLGRIAAVEYFERQNHRGLEVKWAPDSSWCVAVYEARYGFGSIHVLEPKGDRFTQTEIGTFIQKSLDAVIARQSHQRDDSGYGMAYFRLVPDRKLRVRALAYTNPKQFENVQSYFAAFQGTFDLAAKKWAATSTRKISSEENDTLQSGYADFSENDSIVIAEGASAPEDFVGNVFPSEQARAEHLDTRLNEVYQAVRLSVAPTRFAVVKQEQLAWLKQRDATKSSSEQSKRVAQRIKALQEFLW
jgi:hypothetical protein